MSSAQITICGQRLLRPAATTLTCTLREGHRSEFHMDIESVATWSNAGDLIVHTDQRDAASRCDTKRPAVEVLASVSLQHDACGARLTVDHPVNTYPRGWTCALGPHDFQTMHRADDGTQWRATDFPPTAADDPDPKGTAAVAALLQERGEALAKYRDALARTGPCCCADMGEGNLDLDDLCPQHGTVAELARQLTWAHSFTARIMAALPAEWSEPFHGGDAAAEIVDRLGRHDTLDAVRVVLREAGLGFAPVPDDVCDLVKQRDGERERAESREDALARIADLARQAYATTEGGTAADEDLARIIAITEEKNR